MKKFSLPVTVAVLALTVSATPALANHHGHEHKGGPSHFDRMDTNKDGVVTRSEFNASAAKMFDKMDTNKDGKITKAESQDAKKQWHKKFKDKKFKGKKHSMHKHGKHFRPDGQMHRDIGVSDADVRGNHAVKSQRAILR